METQTNNFNPEQAFRHFRQDNAPYVIQMAADNWLVTDFNAESGIYNVWKRTYSYKIQKITPCDAGKSVEFCVMGGGIRELDEFFKNRKPTVFNFMGRPGAGKGTHGGRFAEIYGLPSVRTGELIRESCDMADVTINELANGFVDSGINDNLGKSICVDGYPRNFAQKDHLLSYLSNYNIFTVFLSANKEECMQRMENRHDNSHKTDQNPEINERRMGKYEKYTRHTIKSLKEATYNFRDVYYAEILIESGASKDENFERVMNGMARAVKNKYSWLQHYKQDLQK